MTRVMRGVQRVHKEKGWDIDDVTYKNMADHMFHMKFLPPGRGLWAMGSVFAHERSGAAVNNCGYITVKSSDDFAWAMEMLMLGVGIGFGVDGWRPHVAEPVGTHTFIVPDSREGWAKLVKDLIDSYLYSRSKPLPDYRVLRPEGADIKGFGGKSSGYKALDVLYTDIDKLLWSKRNQRLTSADISDICNFIGKCVVAGNVRRSAEILIGSPYDQEFLQLKDPSVSQEQMMSHRWASNNSIRCEGVSDFSPYVDIIKKGGDLGFVNIQNHRERSLGPGMYPLPPDAKVEGCNPCAEQMLESRELCCLVETFPSKCESFMEFKAVLKSAYIYGKTAVQLMTHDNQTNAIITRNQRLGIGVSGYYNMTQTQRKWLAKGYKTLRMFDAFFSEEWGVRQSVRLTTVKPSGSVSLVADVASGAHPPHSQFYIRRMVFAKNNPLLRTLKKFGYRAEQSVYSEDSMCVEFPVHVQASKYRDDVNFQEHIDVVQRLQEEWSDNAVSVTVSFKPEDIPKLPEAIRKAMNVNRLKTLSLLPEAHGFQQAPFESITKEVYDDMCTGLQRLDSLTAQHDSDDVYCSGDKCEIR